MSDDNFFVIKRKNLFAAKIETPPFGGVVLVQVAG
jgi:hypothetical protein